MHYRILRPMSPLQPDAIVGPEAFLNPMRIRQLVEQRYIEEISEEGDEVEPHDEDLYATLLNTSIRGLRDLLPTINDLQAVKQAKSLDARKVAKQLYALRMEDIQNAKQTH